MKDKCRILVVLSFGTVLYSKKFPFKRGKVHYILFLPMYLKHQVNLFCFFDEQTPPNSYQGGYFVYVQSLLKTFHMLVWLALVLRRCDAFYTIFYKPKRHLYMFPYLQGLNKPYKYKKNSYRKVLALQRHSMYFEAIYVLLFCFFYHLRLTTFLLLLSRYQHQKG